MRTLITLPLAAAALAAALCLPLSAAADTETPEFVVVEGDTLSGLRHLETAVRIKPEMAWPWVNLARIYLAQESIASYDIISDSEIAIVGVAVGRTVLTIWVNDPDRPGEQKVLSYLLRVSQDAGYKVRQEAIFEALQREINRDFPDSIVKLFFCKLFYQNTLLREEKIAPEYANSFVSTLS